MVWSDLSRASCAVLCCDMLCSLVSVELVLMTNVLCIGRDRMLRRGM